MLLCLWVAYANFLLNEDDDDDDGVLSNLIMSAEDRSEKRFADEVIYAGQLSTVVRRELKQEKIGT